jgi:hypothetical protein
MTGHARLQQLTYFSRSLIRGPRWFVETEVDRLLIAARQRNAGFALTGSLLLIDGCFAQILEGPAEALNLVYGTICRDHRHAEPTLLGRSAIAERRFADFSMQYIAEAGATLNLPGSLFGRLERALRSGGP